MKINDFLANKENENLVKKKINSKVHRKIILDILNEDPENNELKNYLFNGYESFLKNKQLMKNNDILLESFFSNNFSLNNNEDTKLKRFELFNDSVQKTILKQNAYKLKKRIISNKYNYLCNEETEKLFLEMAQMDFTKKELQDFVGKKISAFEYAEEFNGTLMNLIEIKAGWDANTFINKLNNSNCIEGIDYDIKHNKEDKLLIDIHTFEAANSIGSKMWCITRDKSMFDHYKSIRYTDYNFLFDFNKNPSKDSSMFAILRNIDNNIEEVYTKADSEISLDKDHKEDNKLCENILEISYKNENTFIDTLKKINKSKNNDFIDWNQKKYNINNKEQIQNIFNLSHGSWFKDITIDEMTKHPELFDLDNMELKNHRIIDIIDVNDFLNRNIQYKEDNIYDLYKKGSMKAKDAQKFFLLPSIKNRMFEEQKFSHLKYLSEKESYDDILELLTMPEISQNIKQKFKSDITYNKSILSFVVKNEGLYEYIKENNRFNDLNTFIDNLKNNIKKEQVDDINEDVYDFVDEWSYETLKATDFNDHIVRSLLDCENDKQYQNLIEILPETKNVFLTSKTLKEDYDLTSVYNILNNSAPDSFKHFQFNGLEKEFIDSFTSKYSNLFIHKHYTLHLYDKENLEEPVLLKFKSAIKQMNSEEYNSNNINNIFKNTLNKFNKINLSNNEEDSGEKRGLNFFIDLIKITNNNPIDIIELLNEEIKKTVDKKIIFNDSGAYSKGHKYFIDTLDKHNLIDFSKAKELDKIENYVYGKTLSYFAEDAIKRLDMKTKTKKELKQKI